MIDNNEFRKSAHQIVDWIADYLEKIEEYPVKPKVAPGEIFEKLPDSAPVQSESISDIMKDLQETIMPGITHWQSPNFFAYFPANSSYPSILAEMITATLGVQGMIWETSPAAAELEEKVMNWLKQMLGIPAKFDGIIQDGASAATLCSILSARERYSHYRINETGFNSDYKYRVYCSTETHSSVDKAVMISGFGKQSLVKVGVDEELRMDPKQLKTMILKDLSDQLKPVCVIATLGTTSTTAIDPLDEISKICQEFGIWLHIDAAFAGTALILPEYRWMIKGIEKADSFVFNPHKWMFTNFDCSAYFVKDKDSLTRTFEIMPEYLKTKTKGQINNYRDWGVPLGRRFRALKLWFVLRNIGIKELQEKIRHHINLANRFATEVSQHVDFELMTPVTSSLVCFRYKPDGELNENELNQLNESLMHRLNDSGKLFLTHTKIRGKFTLRMCIAQTHVQEIHVNRAWQLIQELAR